MYLCFFIDTELRLNIGLLWPSNNNFTTVQGPFATIDVALYHDMSEYIVCNNLQTVNVCQLQILFKIFIYIVFRSA